MVMLEISNFIHFVGLSFGVGGATIAAIISMKAERNPEITPAIMKIMPAISKVIWTGLMLLIISGFMVTAYVTWPIDKQMLLIKHVLVVWIVLIGIFLGKTSRKMGVHAPKGKDKPSPKFLKLKKQMKAFSMINLILWYLVVLISAFV